MAVAKVIYKYIICSYLYVTILFTKVPEYTPFKKIKTEIASGMVLTSTCSPHKAINTSALCFFLRKKKRTGALCCHDVCNRQHQTQSIITRDKQHSTTWQADEEHKQVRDWDENRSDTDGYHWYYICFHIFVRIRIWIRIVSTMPDRIRLDIDIINMWLEYSDMDTVSDVEYPDSDMDRFDSSKRIRSRIRSEISVPFSPVHMGTRVDLGLTGHGDLSLYSLHSKL